MDNWTWTAPVLFLLTLVATRQSQDVLSHERHDQVSGDRGHTVEPGLAPFAFDVEFRREPVSAVGLQAHIACLPLPEAKQTAQLHS